MSLSDHIRKVTIHHQTELPAVNKPFDPLTELGPYYVIDNEKAQKHIDQAIHSLENGNDERSIANALIALAILHCPQEHA